MKTEKVFEILGEGGGICIKRQKNKSAEIFLYGHQEFDPTDEGLDVNKKGVFKTFEEPFQIINERYQWFMLHFETVHEDYRDYIIDKLIQKLNEESISTDYLEYSKERLEESLRIRLMPKPINNNPKWSFIDNISEINVTLPFFSYGFFRPGEISFLGIKEFVLYAVPFTIGGELVLRDGVTLFKESKEKEVVGYLITFKPESASDAYSLINSLEPKKLFKWKEKDKNGMSFNILYGVKPNKGSDYMEKEECYTIWEDPYFTTALEVLEETPNDNFEWNLKPLFKLQMKYMLLWTILERFTFLRYSLGGGPTVRNKLLAENKYFKEALLKYVKREHTVYSTEDPDNKTTLSIQNPKKSIDYYYQVRCNVTHRGKSVNKDYYTVKDSYNELFKITKHILEKTKNECNLIKKEYEAKKN